jgi:cation:H+ antiporter
VTIFLLIVGLGLLIVGAEFLVRGASKLAAAVGLSPLIIGLTVVAYGTSSPEMAVSVLAAREGQADLALGNVVGSNIFNVLFILGVSALITPLVISRQLIRIDVPIMIGVSLLTLFLALDGKISTLDGIIFVAGIVAYSAFQIYYGRKEEKAKNEVTQFKKEKVTPGQWLLNIVYIVGGLTLLVVGARWLVNGAIFIAQSFGVSELVIGLTIVAAGTSLPEVATSIVASIRGQRDIAVGNVVGSNIFNILAVLGFSTLFSRGGVGINVAESALRFDIPVMIAVALACLPIFFTGRVIARWEGFVFLGYYVVYTVYLILAATQNPALTSLNAALLWFVLPLTVLTFAIVTIRSLQARPKIN